MVKSTGRFGASRRERESRSMQHTNFSTNEAPAPIGPYSQGIIANGFVFLSGQIGSDPATGVLASGLEAQTHLIMKNIRGALAAANSDWSHVVKATIFLTSMKDFVAVNAIYATYLGNVRPARSAVAVAELPMAALLEIEVVALARP
jgi:2-iminobutanoate/2-iminopropanoate deaminase